jgi:N-acetylglucosaminyldiphosphoundecaprenol N-acetyl-beta-D-mannosaminyltransferase
MGRPPPGADLDSRYVLGVRVDATSYAETTEHIAELAAAGVGGAVCVANVHVVMEAVDDPAFRRGVNSAERVTPDGVPLVWALRLLGVSGAERVYGPSLTPIVCARAAELGLPVGFYGGSPAVLDAMVAGLAPRFPGLEVAFAHSPPFRPLTEEEDRKMVAAIEDSGTRILFVGLGCPKQERWMDEHRDDLSCVLVGVGAAFDFLAGAKPQAPAWMQRAGLEWVFRLLTEPRRLWRRYLLNNPRFLARLAVQLARQGRTPG